MRKVHLKVALLLVIVLLTSVSSGCSKTKQAGKGIESMGSLKTKPFTATTLTFYYPSVLGGFDIRKDVNLVFKEIEKKAEDLKIQLDFKAIPLTELQQKTDAAIEAGEPVDAIIFYKPYASNDFTVLARKGELADITKLLPQYAPNIAQMLSEYGQRCIEVDGKGVGLPSLNPMANSCIVSAREYFLNNYNIPDIKTLDDYEIYLKTVKENEGDIAPGWLDEEMLMIFAKAYGYEVLDETQNLVYKRDDPNMRVRPWEQTPEFKEAVNLICKWHKNGYIAEGSNIDLNNASKVSSTLFHACISGIDESHVTPDGITMKYFLMYPDVEMTRVSLSDDCGAIAFNSHSPDIERALMFLDWIQKDQENYELFIYGIKGKHYTIADNQIKLPEGVNCNNSRYYPWEGSQTFKNPKWERRDGADNKNGVQLILKSSQYAPHEGFHPDYSKVQDEAGSRERLIVSEINELLYNGTFMSGNTDEVIENLRRMGTEEIVDEVQQQLDQWRASH